MSPFLSTWVLFTEGRDNWGGQQATVWVGQIYNHGMLHIVETSVIKGIPIFIPTEFLLQTAVLVYKVIGILLVNKIVDLQDLKIKKNKNSTGNLF